MTEITPETFIPFQKIARLSRACIITEKIDGTNAQIQITEDGRMFAGSRTRWLSSASKAEDNHHFAAWVDAHKAELMQLGPGRHFGEWWGLGINRGYNLFERRFSLFNTRRWTSGGEAVKLPACCSLVPVLYAGVFSDWAVKAAVEKLRETGSVAAPGFMQPEGVVVFHAASGQLFKKTLERDEEWKGARAA